MPPKKAPAKKAPAAKKAAKKATSKKATPERPAGVVKKNTPSKTASTVKKPTKATATPKSARPKPTREIFGDIRKSQSQLPYSPDTDVSGPLRSLGEESERERAAEIFRLYGGAAVEACGYDQTVLLNACLDIAFNESAGSVNDNGWRYTDGTLETRYGKCDLNHYADWRLWISRLGKMRTIMEELVQKDQTERQKVFFAVGNHSANTPLHLYGDSKEVEKKWKDARALAAYYKKHPEKGNSVPGKKPASTPKVKKTPVEKVVPASTTKKTPTKKTSATKGSTVKKPATKAGAKKTRAKTKA
jgi:hypothetical protein